jgi:hypothetical protein
MQDEWQYCVRGYAICRNSSIFPNDSVALGVKRAKSAPNPVNGLAGFCKIRNLGERGGWLTPPSWDKFRSGECKTGSVGALRKYLPVMPDAKPPEPAPLSPDGRWIWREARWCWRRERARKHARSLVPRRPRTCENPSAFATAIQQILPWENFHDYPGRGQGYRELFGGRVTRRTITNWRNGRAMPEWAIQAASGWLETRAQAMLEAARRLREETPRDRRKGNGGRVPHRKRAERLAREAAERQLNAPIPASNSPPVRGKSDCRLWVEARLGRELD